MREIITVDLGSQGKPGFAVTYFSDGSYRVWEIATPTNVVQQGGASPGNVEWIRNKYPVEWQQATGERIGGDYPPDTGGPPTGTPEAQTGAESTTTPVRTTGVFAGMTDQEVADYQRLLQESAGWDREKFERQMEYQKAALDQQYKLAMMQAKTERQRMEIDKWYKGEQLKLAQQAHELDTERLAVDYLKTAAQMGGPADYFQSADLMAGLSQRQQTAKFLQNLWNGVGAPAFNAPGGIPTPQSVETIAQQLGAPPPGASPTYQPSATTAGALPATIGTGLTVAQAQPELASGKAPGSALPASVSTGLPATVGTGPRQSLSPAVSALLPSPAFRAQSDAANLSMVRDLAARGAHKLAPGTLESMDIDDRALLGSAFKKIGVSPDRFVRQYFAARPNQGSALGA